MDFLKDHGGIFGLLGLLVAVFGLIYTWYRTAALEELKEKLDDPHHRAQVMQHRASHWGAAYFVALADLTDWAERFYGPAKLGWRALGRSMLLAFVYPILAALLAWVVANVHSPGGFKVFHDLEGTWSRSWRAGTLIVGIVALALYVGNMDRILRSVNDAVGKCISKWARADGFLSKASARLIHLIGGAVVFAGEVIVVGAVVVAFVGVGAVVGVGAGAVAGAVVVAVAGAGAGAVLVTVAVAGAGAVVGAGVGTGAEIIEEVAAYVFIAVLLPVTNAVADFLSVAATRSFLGAVRKERPGFAMILVLLGCDLLAGGACLGLLLYLLSAALDAWAALSPATLPIDWRAYLDTAMADPWQGMALWLMAFTTLLPTLVHGVMGTAAMLSHRSRLNARALAELHEAVARGRPSPADRTAIAKRFIRADLYGFCLVLSAIIAICILFTRPWIG